MAGAKLSPVGADVRKLIRDTYENGGNPTIGTLKEELAKVLKKHGEKKEDSALQSFFNSHKIAVQKQDGKSDRPAKTSGKKRGRPAGSKNKAKETSIPLFDNGAAPKKRGRPAKVNGHASTNGHLAGNGFDLAIQYAKQAGGLDKAIATLNQLKAIKEAI